MATAPTALFTYSLYHKQSKETLWNGRTIDHGQGYYGVSLAISTKNLVVAASGGMEKFGMLNIYPNSDGTGFSSSNAYVLNPDLPHGAGFGNSISMSGYYLMVGCSSYSDYSGAVYFYLYDSPTGRFVQQQIINDPAITSSGAGISLAGSEFADAVFVDSTSQTLVVSAPNYQKSDGIVVIYLRDATSGQWIQSSEIPGPAGMQSYFGSPIAATDLLLCVAAVRYDVPSPRRISSLGAVFVYIRANYAAPYKQLQLITADAAGLSASSVYTFGNTLALSKDYLFVGSGQAGIVSIFTYSATTQSFTFIQKLVAPIALDSSYFGYTMALQGEVIAFGHMTKNIITNTQRSGVYIYARKSVSSAAFSFQQYIYPSPIDNQEYEYLGNYIAIAEDGTMAVSNVGTHDPSGDMLLFSPLCLAGQYVQMQQPGVCVLCPGGTYDSDLGAGTSPAVCKACPASRSGTPAGSSSCAYSSALPTRKPSIAPSLRPTTALQPSVKPTPKMTPESSSMPPIPPSSASPTALPTSYPIKLRGVPTYTPTFYPSLASPNISQIRRSSPRPTAKPVKVQSVTPLNSTADPDSMSTAAVVSAVLACVVLLVVSILCYRRYFREREKDEEEVKEVKKKRLTAYEKWVIYEDNVRARRIQSIFQANETTTDKPDGTSGSANVTALAPSIEIPTILRLSTGRRSSASRLSVTDSGRYSVGNSAGPGHVGSSDGVISSSPMRSSFNELGGLFRASAQEGEDSRRSSGTRRTSFGFGYGFANFGLQSDPNPTSLKTDEDLRESITRLGERPIALITLADATAAIQESRSNSEPLASASTLNPLMGGSLQSATSISSLRANMSQGKRMSVAAATRVGNPLFNTQSRRASLQNRLGLPPPGSVATGTIPAGGTLDKNVVVNLADVTPTAQE